MKYLNLLAALFLASFLFARMTRADGFANKPHGLERRQNAEATQPDTPANEPDTSKSTEKPSTPATTSAPSTTPSTTAPSTTPTPTTESTTSTSSTTTSDDPPVSTPDPTTSDKPTSTSKSSTEKSSTEKTTSSAETLTTTLVPTTTIKTHTNIVTITLDGGAVSTSSSVSTETAVSHIPSVVPAKGSNSSNSSGLSTTQRNTIIGVVVGIGGAIMIGAIVMVLLRIRRKRAEREEDEDLGIAGTSEMGHGLMDNSRVAEMYSKPHGPVNQGVNF